MSDCSDYLVHNEFARLPLKMDAPEKVLSQAHGQAGRVVDFLHENGIYLLNICIIFLLHIETKESLHGCVLTMNSLTFMKC